MSFSVRFVPSEADVPEPLWRELFPPQQEGRWWYRTLETSGLEGQISFLYAVILDGGMPVGLAPLFVMDVPITLVVPEGLYRLFALLGRVFAAARVQRTLFVGSPCADQGHVGLLAGVDRGRALACLQAALQAKAKALKAPMLVWKDFPAETDDELGRLAAATGMFRLVSFPGAVAALPGPRKEDYLAALKASYRQKLKRKVRLAVAAADLAVEVVRQPDRATLDALFTLFTQTYEKGAVKFERLDRRFFERVAAEAPAHFLLLRERASGDLVAFMLCFACGSQVINKFIGIDYGRPKDWLLYFRLWDAVVDFALAQGATAVQSGQTGYTAKIETGHRLVPLTNWCRHRNPVVHRVYRAVARRVAWHTLDPALAQQ